MRSTKQQWNGGANNDAEPRAALYVVFRAESEVRSNLILPSDTVLEKWGVFGMIQDDGKFGSANEIKGLMIQED